MSEQVDVSKMLKSCRPLADPASAWARVTATGMLVGAVLNVFLAIHALLRGDEGQDEGVGIIFALLIALCSWFALWPILRLALLPKVLYLRSFSTDRGTQGNDPVRDLVRLSLPKGLSMGGIRPPGYRAPWWSRWLLGNSSTAYRYLGSNLFELEAADRNWYARLLASISQARAIMIDMRTLTPFVHDEIKFAAHIAREPHRVFLVVDDSSLPTVWLDRFAEAAGGPASIADRVTLLRVPENGEATPEIVENIKTRLASIPNESIPIDQLLLREATERVQDKDWTTSVWGSPALQTVFSLVLFTVISFALGAIDPDHAMWLLIPFGTMAVMILLLYYRCLFRILGWARARKKAGLQSTPGAGSAWLAGVMYPLILLLILFPSLLAIGAALDRASSVSALVQVTSLATAVEGHYAEYGVLPSDAPKSRTDEADGVALLSVLAGEDQTPEGPNRMGIMFLQAKEVTVPKGGLYRDDTGRIAGMYDPWGNPLTVFLDVEYKGHVTYRYGEHENTISRSCVVLSAGPDGREGTDDDIVSH
jgi:hypothetical protein